MNLIACTRAYRLLLGKLRIGYSFLSLDFTGTAMKSLRSQMQMEEPLDIAQVALCEIRMAALAVELQMILTITQLLQTESLKNGWNSIESKRLQTALADQIANHFNHNLSLDQYELSMLLRIDQLIGAMFLDTTRFKHSTYVDNVLTEIFGPAELTDEECQWVTVKTISFPERLAKVKSTDALNPKSVKELHSILSDNNT